MTKDQFLEMLASAQSVSSMLDEIFRLFDDWHLEGNFAASNKLLEDLDVLELDEQQVVGILCITRLAALRGHLPAYQDFLAACAEHFEHDVVKGFDL